MINSIQEVKRMNRKKCFGVVLTAAALIGCLAVPSFAGGNATSRVSLEGKYIDSLFSQRAINQITASSSDTKTTATVTLNYGWGKNLSDSSWRKKGSYTLRTSYVYSSQIKNYSGSCKVN